VVAKFTLNSVVFLTLTIFAVVVAWVFKNPLLVYTAVFFVVTNVALFIWAQQSVAGIRVIRRHSRQCVARQPVEITLELTNNRRSPRYGILGFDVHEELGSGQPNTPVAFLEAPPRQAVTSSYTIAPPRRGVFKLGPFYLYGGDPFGFYKCWRKVDTGSELTVLPAALPFSTQRSLSASRLRQDEIETIPQSGESTEFFGVREYVAGEPLRRVHWRTSARLGRLISRQYELNVAASVSVLLLASDEMLTGTRTDNPLEHSITMTASLGYATLADRFHLSYLALSGGSYDNLSGTGRNFYESLALKLARFGGTGSVEWEKHRKLIANYIPAASHLIVFAARHDATTRERLRQLAVHCRGVTAVTFDLDSFERLNRPRSPVPRTLLDSGYLHLEAAYGTSLARVLTQALGRPALLRRGA
jgi:uncharacterized protein (DUF58 family)